MSQPVRGYLQFCFDLSECANRNVEASAFSWKELAAWSADNIPNGRPIIWHEAPKHTVGAGQIQLDGLACPDRQAYSTVEFKNEGKVSN
jgi:hypothetical protein